MTPFNKLMDRIFGANPNALQTKKSATAGLGPRGGGINPSTWLTQGGPNWSGRTYDVLVREGFRNNVIANRSVKILAESAASVPLVLFEGDKRLESHPVLDLIRTPNPLQSGRELLEAFYAFLQISGNSYLETVNKTDGTPGELYVLRPDRMSVIPGPNGWPERYVYKVGGASHSFPVENDNGFSDILHLKTFHPQDDWYGLSPLEAASYSLDIKGSEAQNLFVCQQSLSEILQRSMEDNSSNSDNREN